MHMWKMLICTALFCCLSSMAFANGGVEIGASFPVGGGRTVSAGDGESYASFAADNILAEVSASEEKGALHMELKLTNLTDNAISIGHRCGQSYDFTLEDTNGKILYRWSDGMAFTQALTSASIPAKDSMTYTAEIAKKDYKKIRDNAVVMHVYITDTPYVVGLKLPSRTETHVSQPITLQGSIGVGSGGFGW